MGDFRSLFWFHREKIGLSLLQNPFGINVKVGMHGHITALNFGQIILTWFCGIADIEINLLKPVSFHFKENQSRDNLVIHLFTLFNVLSS